MEDHNPTAECPSGMEVFSCLTQKPFPELFFLKLHTHFPSCLVTYLEAAMQDTGAGLGASGKIVTSLIKGTDIAGLP